VPPEKVDATLTAMSESLEGRGTDLGETIAIANRYLKKFSPETQQTVEDLQQFGEVADTYASHSDEFGKLLSNTSKVSRNVVDIRHDLGDFFDETTTLSKTLRRLVKRSGNDWILTARNSKQPLAVADEYASMFPCLFRGMDRLTTDHLSGVYANGTLHTELVTISPQPTVYALPERPVIPTESSIESVALTDPGNHGFVDGVPALGKVCDQLNDYADDGIGPYDHAHPFPQISGKIWKLGGILNSHNGKLGRNSQYQRPVASSLDGIDTPAQRDVLNRMTSGLTGVKHTEVPDIASLMISPVVRGAEVTVR